MTDPFTTLDGTFEQVWQRLARGVADRRAPARHPVLATVGADGAEARVVVLRAADRAAGTLTIHTDSASAKVTELRGNPGATLLVWDEKAKLQTRLRATVEIVEGDADTFARLPDAARTNYGGTPPPGTPIPDPGAHDPAPEASRFAILLAHVREIETLHLGTPHRRARFRDGVAQWLAP